MQQQLGEPIGITRHRQEPIESEGSMGANANGIGGVIWLNTTTVTPQYYLEIPNKYFLIPEAETCTPRLECLQVDRGEQTADNKEKKKLLRVDHKVGDCRGVPNSHTIAI